MAARPLLVVVKSMISSPRQLHTVFRATSRLAPVSTTLTNPSVTQARNLHVTSSKAVKAASASIGQDQRPSTSPSGQTPSPAAPEYDTKHAAFLGEADSNDAFEAAQDINPSLQEALDARHAAYLGEADSDDGFESHREAYGRLEAVDLSDSAYLGEADRDDGFESQQILNPTDHGPLDPSPSAFHGQPGEHDTYEEENKGR
jgi:hypothetical protein